MPNHLPKPKNPTPQSERWDGSHISPCIAIPGGKSRSYCLTKLDGVFLVVGWGLNGALRMRVMRLSVRVHHGTRAVVRVAGVRRVGVLAVLARALRVVGHVVGLERRHLLLLHLRRHLGGLRVSLGMVYTRRLVGGRGASARGRRRLGGVLALLVAHKPETKAEEANKGDAADDATDDSASVVGRAAGASPVAAVVGAGLCRIRRRRLAAG